MKTLRNLLGVVVLMVLISSCATNVKFPVSTITPGAEIGVKMKKDKNKNFQISVTANYLASADRLTPPMKTYVVWITTTDNSLRNIGKLISKSSEKSTLETVTSFEPVEIMITAEEEGDISSPSGVEISRTKLKK